MRHRKKTIKLGRKSAHRKAMLANMASSLIEHKRINSTLTKAKALKVFIEPLITKSKNDNTHNRRLCFSKLRDKIAVTTLFDEVAKKIGDRRGGYTRIIKLGNRMGDNASMAMIEFVDYNEIYSQNNKTIKSPKEESPKEESPKEESPKEESPKKSK
ncbi:MAG: 50S ribosomal protein L17 [Candidatus Marisimplicoccus sp.]